MAATRTGWLQDETPEFALETLVLVLLAAAAGVPVSAAGIAVARLRSIARIGRLALLGVLLGSLASRLTNLTPSEKMRVSREQYPAVFAGGCAPTQNLISESGVYTMVLRSNRPEARGFQDWVTRDVLPAIRKDGAYVMGEEKVATGELSIEEMTLRVVDALQKKIARLTEANKAMPDELNVITVDEYRAPRHAYWPLGFGSVLGKEATLVALMRGVELTQQSRTIRRLGKTIPVKVNVYPRAIIEAAFGRVEWRLKAMAA